MTTAANVAEALDGPAGWAVVLLVGAVLVWVAVDAIGNEEDKIGQDIQHAQQELSCWFNNSCVVADVWNWVTS